jgi:hypothetical protein
VPVSSAASRRRCGGRALRLLERQGLAVDPADERRPISRLRHGRGDDRRDRANGSRPGSPSRTCATCAASPTCSARTRRSRPRAEGAEARRLAPESETIELPAYEEVTADKLAFADMTRKLHHETNPHNARRLVQPHGDRLLVVNPAGLRPRREDGRWTALRPALHAPPAPDATRAAARLGDDQALRPDHARLLRRLHVLLDHDAPRAARSRAAARSRSCARSSSSPPIPDFKGHRQRLGGPTANMYRMRCTRPEVEAKCRRLSCVHPTICKLLGTDHGRLIDLMRAARETSRRRPRPHRLGIRMDLAADDPSTSTSSRAPRRRPSQGRPRARQRPRARS